MRIQRVLRPILIASAAFIHILSLWQLDLIAVLPVWNTPLFQQVLAQQGLTNYAEGYFQCWIWRTTVGAAYDTLFFLNFLSFWILFAALAPLQRRRKPRARFGRQVFPRGGRRGEPFGFEG